MYHKHWKLFFLRSVQIRSEFFWNSFRILSEFFCKSFGILFGFTGIVLMTPAGIFYFSSDNKRRITSFVELLLFSVGAFLLTSSVISMLIGCIRRGQNRRKLASLQITTTNRQGIIEKLGMLDNFSRL